jgi:OmpA-OmpF porin, OOP family
MKLFLTAVLSFVTLLSQAQTISSRYELVKMDKTVNTFHHEGAPVITPDGNTLYFFVTNHPDNTHGKEDSQDIWMSKKDANGAWGQAEHLSSPFNIHPYNQVLTAFEDGSLFIKGGRSKGEKGFSLVTSGGSLQELNVKDFKSMNQGRFYGATMSADKKHIIIYFSEKSGAIASDLYASHVQPDGSWSKPQMLKINSPQDDVGTFIGPDQNTLYFASARTAPGRQGQTDVYKCTRLDDTWTNFSTPVNVGKPINTNGEDFYFTMDKAGNVITSRANKAIEGAQLDLYVLVPKTMKINLNGIVFNAKTKDPLLANVEIKPKDHEVIKLKSGTDGLFTSKFTEVSTYTVSATAPEYLPTELTFQLPLIYSDTTVSIEVPMTPEAKKMILIVNVLDKHTEKTVSAKVGLNHRVDKKIALKDQAPNGVLEKEIPKFGLYLVTASAEGYLNGSDSVQISEGDRSPISMDIYLEPIEVGVTVRLKNIYFDFDKTHLKNESFPELNKVVDFLKTNPTVEIEISGHTDNKGSDEYNANLSQGRSEEVVKYIIGQGIDSYRLTAHGYGESKPIDSNDTDEGRANNRRVEFTIVKK